MEKVDLGGKRKRFEMVPLPRYGIMVRKGLVEKAEKEFDTFEKWSATGIVKRIDKTPNNPFRYDQAEGILDWIWSGGLTLAQQLVAEDCSTVQLDGNPMIFHKYNYCILTRL